MVESSGESASENLSENLPTAFLSQIIYIRENFIFENDQFLCEPCRKKRMIKDGRNLPWIQ